MQYPTLVANNWNGTYLNDCFRLIKPYSEEYVTGTVFLIKDGIHEGTNMGYAKLITANKVLFRDLNDAVSFSIINKQAGYLKSILDKMHKLNSTDVLQVLTLQWTERNLEAHRVALMCHWDHIVKTTPHGISSPFRNINYQPSI